MQKIAGLKNVGSIDPCRYYKQGEPEQDQRRLLRASFLIALVWTLFASEARVRTQTKTRAGSGMIREKEFYEALDLAKNPG